VLSLLRASRAASLDVLVAQVQAMRAATDPKESGHVTMNGDASITADVSGVRSGPHVGIDLMSWVMASVVRGATTRTVVAVALIGTVVMGATVPGDAASGVAGMPGTPVPLEEPTGPEDPACMAQPYLSQCMGGPWDLPSSASDPTCAVQPGDPVCVGPAAPPPPPPSPPPGFGPGTI
jgi:hypothetical protein